MSNATETLYLKCWIGNLGKYNEGELVGEWFDMPCDMTEVARVIGLNEEYEECQINDYETNIHGLEIHHYSSIEKLNEFMEQIVTLVEHEQLIMQAYIEHNGIYDLLNDKDSISFEDARIYYDCEDMEDVAREYAEETGLLDSMPKNLQSYFDFEAFGRDLSYDGTFVFLHGNICVEFYH